MPTVQCFIQMDPLSTLNTQTDTTLLLAKEALKRGHKVMAFSPFNVSLIGDQLSIVGGRLWCDGVDQWRQGPSKPLNSLDAHVVLVRQEPPFDMNYITNTHLLQFWAKSTLVLNPPQVLRDWPEKIIPYALHRFMPKSLVSSDPSAMALFLKAQGTIIIKPLYLFGGQGVKRLSSPQELAKYLADQADKKTPFILQEFLPQIQAVGDKRFLFIDGALVAQFTRKPPAGGFLSNLHQGGQAHPCGLTKVEEKLCQAVSRFLKNHDIFLAGVDVAQEKLLEVNITCPTGFAAAKALYNIDLSATFWDKLEKRLLC